jgi:hypothetical protein
MICSEYLRLAGLSDSKREAYQYIRLNEGRAGLSKSRYDELVQEGYEAMKSAIKDLGWHKMNCSICKSDPAR